MSDATPIDWRAIKPISGDKRVRLPDVLAQTNFKNHASIYTRIKAGMFPPQIRDGGQAFWWQSHIDHYNRIIHEGQGAV